MSLKIMNVLAGGLIAALPSISQAEIGASVSVGGGSVADADVTVGGGSVADADATVGDGSAAEANVTVGGSSAAEADVTVGGGNTVDADATLGGGSVAGVDAAVGAGSSSLGMGEGVELVGMPLIGSNGDRLGQIVSVSGDKICSDPYDIDGRNVCVRIVSTPVVTRSGLQVRIDPSVYRSNAQ